MLACNSRSFYGNAPNITMLSMIKEVSLKLTVIIIAYFAEDCNTKIVHSQTSYTFTFSA